MKPWLLLIAFGIIGAQLLAEDSNDWIDLPFREGAVHSIPVVSEIDHYTLSMSDKGEPGSRSISRTDGEFVIAALRNGIPDPDHSRRMCGDMRFTFAAVTRDGRRFEFHCKVTRSHVLFTLNWETYFLAAPASAALLERLGLANLPNPLHGADDLRLHAPCGAGDRASLDRRSYAVRSADFSSYLVQRACW